jgi:predicted glycoside hydrolase/deacetylase ChbG (UPF0249 family)
MTKYLIINADDFGMSNIFNEEILNLIRNDLIFSTTIMVNRVSADQKEQFKELINLSRNKNLSIGLHLEFENDNYILQIKDQFDKFNKILGFIPSHIDIHKVHSLMKSVDFVAKFCEDKEIPLRNSGKNFEKVKMIPFEAFFGSIADFNKIEEWIKTFEDEEFHEILFHPGKFDKNCKSSLNKDRERDVKHIKKINTIVNKYNIKIVSYLDL